VVPPGAAYVEKVDPRLYCFGEKAAAALVPGATVVPRLTGTRDEPVVEPLEVEPTAPARFATLAEAPGF
jgi:hypothetical protein